MTEVSYYPALLRERYSRGGHWWTRAISQRIGSHAASIALDRRISPNAISIAQAALSVLTALVALVLYQEGLHVAAAGITLVGLQSSYALDCADGQVARFAGTGSAAGARIDLACDFIVQIAVLSLAFGVVGITIGLPGWAVTCIAGGWLVPVLTESLKLGAAVESSAANRYRIYSILGAFRDYGFHAGILAIGLALSPSVVLAVLVVVAALHYAYLAKYFGDLLKS